MTSKKEMQQKKVNFGEILKRLFPNAHGRGGTQKIDMNMLHADLPYQKKPNKKLVQKIKKDFSPLALDPLVVSYRDGRYNVVDGQHRLCAIIELFRELGGTFMIECRVIDGLTKEDECRLFKMLSERRTVPPSEQLEADYEAGEIWAVDMVNTINNVGLLFDFKNTKGKNRITATEAITKIYIELGHDNFKRYLKLLKDTWGGDPLSLQRFMLNGVFEFFTAYMFDYDRKTFIKKLSKISPFDIQREGKSDLTVKGFTGYAKAIVMKYNKGFGDNNRLDISKLY